MSISYKSIYSILFSLSLLIFTGCGVADGGKVTAKEVIN